MVRISSLASGGSATAIAGVPSSFRIALRGGATRNAVVGRAKIVEE